MVTGRRVDACLCNGCASEGVIAGRSPLCGPAERYKIDPECDVCHTYDRLRWPEICPLRAKNDAESTCFEVQILSTDRPDFHCRTEELAWIDHMRLRVLWHKVSRAAGSSPRQPTRPDFVAIGQSGLPVDTSSRPESAQTVRGGSRGAESSPSHENGPFVYSQSALSKAVNIDVRSHPLGTASFGHNCERQLGAVGGAIGSTHNATACLEYFCCGTVSVDSVDSAFQRRGPRHCRESVKSTLMVFGRHCG